MGEKKAKRLPRGGTPVAWPADTRREVRRWLRAQLEALAKGEEQSKAMIQVADLESLRNQLIYYRHAQGAVRWLLNKIDRAARAKGDPEPEPTNGGCRPAEAG